jgi:hypothetical protein
MEQAGDNLRAGSKNMYCLLGITINTPKFAQNSLASQHTFGTMEKCMGVLYIANKTYHIKTVE